MTADEIIFQSFLNNPLQGEGLFVVEGNPAKNEIRVKPADQAYKDGLDCFAWNVNHGYQYMGIFTEERLAKEFVDRVRERIRNENGDRLI